MKEHSMKDLATHYPAHISELQQRSETIMARENITSVVIHSGHSGRSALRNRAQRSATSLGAA